VAVRELLDAIASSAAIRALVVFAMCLLMAIVILLCCWCMMNQLGFRNGRVQFSLNPRYHRNEALAAPSPLKLAGTEINATAAA
jgi:hypothetical protein